jgi:hypothetical protein
MTTVDIELANILLQLQYSGYISLDSGLELSSIIIDKPGPKCLTSHISK